MDQLVSSAQQDVAEMAANLTTKVTAMVQDIESTIAAADFTPDDYDPPRYQYAGNTSSETEAQSSRSQVSSGVQQQLFLPLR